MTISQRRGYVLGTQCGWALQSDYAKMSRAQQLQFLMERARIVRETIFFDKELTLTKKDYVVETERKIVRKPNVRPSRPSNGARKL